MVVTPTRCWNCLISWRAEARNLASRFESGSSSKRAVGSRTKARAGATPRGPPPAPSRGRRAGRLGEAGRLGSPRPLLMDLGAGHALGAQWKCDVVAHREVWVEAVALEHHCHAAGARWNFVDNVAADQEVAACLLFEPADDAQKGRLAAARRA